jgi:hypothetical protein
VKGRVILEGKAPEMPEINMAAVKECATQHPDPVTEESIIADAKGNLKNVVVYVSAGLPQQQYDPPSEPAVLDQRGCMYHPHVLPVMVGQKIMIKNSDNFRTTFTRWRPRTPGSTGQQPDPASPSSSEGPEKILREVRRTDGWDIVGLRTPSSASRGDDGLSPSPTSCRRLTPDVWHDSWELRKSCQG